jgi:type IV pilus assembly protein PilE
MDMKLGKGFTVIELVVAVTIVCLLVAVAVASFQDHMIRKDRASAIKALVETAEWLRSQHASSGTYQVKLPEGLTQGDAAYRIELLDQAVTANDPKAEFPATSAEIYSLRAVPRDDASCGSLLLDSAGRMGVTGANAKVTDCWR